MPEVEYLDLENKPVLAERDKRIIHALSKDGEEQIVRYQKAGKYWIEFIPPKFRSAEEVSIKQAVLRALFLKGEGGRIFFGRPGGSAFDREVKKWMPAESSKGKA